MVPRVKSERLHLYGRNTFLSFLTERTYCAFFVPFSLKIQMKGVTPLKEKEVQIITYGGIDFENMSEAEQRAFYASLLARVLEQIKENRQSAEG